MSRNLKRHIEENAKEIRRLHSRVGETFKLRDRSPEDREQWSSACAEFHGRYDQLAFPGGYDGALERILAGDDQSIEAALCFVECRPYFFRSGYMYKDVLRKLKRAPLNARQSKRLAEVVAAYEDYRAKRGAHGA